MAVQETKSRYDLPSPVYRWVVLVFLSLAMFGNYYVYDSISPLADILKKQLGFSDRNIGLLNMIYSLPNIFFVLIGGIIIDTLGTRKSAIIFSLTCMLGSFITTFSGGNLTVMATGRLIFGLGAETLIVTITTILAKWFKGKELSFAFGLNLTIARLGSFAALNSPTWAKSLYWSWKGPLLISAGAATLSVLTLILYVIIEAGAQKRFSLGPEPRQDKIVLSDVLSFGKAYWFITILCVTFYSAIFPFQTFAIKFFIEHHGLTRQAAGFASSVITLAAMIGTPLFGLFVDKYGKRASVMIIGSLLIVPVYILFVYSRIHPIFLTSIMGIAFSLVPAAMWPSVALIVKQENLGTAYGLMTMIQNIGLTLFNYIIGWANDISTVNGVTDYRLGMWIFSITGIVGLIFAILLRKERVGRELLEKSHM